MPTTYGVLMRDGINYSHDTAESISYTNTGSGLSSTDVQAAIDEIYSTRILPVGGTTDTYLRGDGTWQTPDNTTYGIVSAADHGLVPSGGTSTKYLRGDGTWQVPPNDTYAVMSSGTTGLAPKGTSGKFLRGDGTWQTPDNTTYPIVSTAAAGLVRMLTGSTVNYLRGDGTWQKPDNTTYAVATTAKEGLVRSGGTYDKYLRADGKWATPVDTDTKVTQSATSSGVGNCYVLFTLSGSSASQSNAAAMKGPMIYGYTSGDTYLLYNYVRLRFDQVYLDTNVLVINSLANQQLVLGASNETNYRCFIGVRSSTWTFCSWANNVLRLGNANYRWRKIYADTGTINTSDRNQKDNIVDLGDSAKDFIMDLKPVSYKFKNNNPDIVHDRTHYGLIAQDVEDTMTKMGMTALDFGGFCKDQKMEEYRDEDAKIMYNPDNTPILDSDGLPYKPTKHRPVEGEYVYGLRYEEFIAPIIKTIQMQEEEIQTRKLKIDELKSRLDILENK